MMNLLVGETIHRPQLSDHTIETMFDLFQDYFVADFDTFQRDLGNKNWVILLKNTVSGSIEGFSTLAFYKSIVDLEEIGIVYSGDTIIRPEYWGAPELPRTWIKTVLEIGETLPKPLYWLLISSGYKTYRFLSVFYKEYYPRYNRQTPPKIQSTIHHLAKERFGEEYDPKTGVIRFTSGATPLRAGVAEISGRRLKDPNVAFFIQKNPGHAQGDELVCLTHIDPENLTPAGKRMIR